MVQPIDNSLRSIIRHGLSLEIACKKCSRKVVVDARLIARKVDPDTSIHRLPLSCDFAVRANSGPRPICQTGNKKARPR